MIERVFASSIMCKSTIETEATLTGLPTGATVKIRVVSVNDNGTEAKAGYEVQVVIG